MSFSGKYIQKTVICQGKINRVVPVSTYTDKYSGNSEIPPYISRVFGILRIRTQQFQYIHISSNLSLF